MCVFSSQRDNWGLPALKLKCDERLTAAMEKGEAQYFLLVIHG